MLNNDGDVMKWLEGPELNRLMAKEAGWKKLTDQTSTKTWQMGARHA
jgi:hypothetical protein